jgi:hypothetical protein
MTQNLLTFYVDGILHYINLKNVCRIEMLPNAEEATFYFTDGKDPLTLSLSEQYERLDTILLGHTLETAEEVKERMDG